jgi:uncharacterized membrane protein
MIEGVLILVPLGMTFLILDFVFRFLDGFLRPGIARTVGRNYPGEGIIALLILVYLVGLVWDYGVGRRLLRLVQRSLLGIPIVRVVYAPARQLVDSFSGDSTSGFQRVVAIEYPRQETWMIGFLTSTTIGMGNIPMGVVYVPTAPTPNSGWVAIVPIQDIYDTNLSVPDAMSMVLSGGIATPSHLEMRTLKELLEGHAEGEASSKAEPETGRALPT